MYVSVAPRRSMNTWDLQYSHRTRVVDTSKEMGAPHFGQSTVATAPPYAGGPPPRGGPPRQREARRFPPLHEGRELLLRLPGREAEHPRDLRERRWPVV